MDRDPFERNSSRPRTAHLVGIAGSGMRALAYVLLGKGWRLSGSDPAIADDDPLIRTGIRCFREHSASQLSTDVELVIHSSAIADDNPELRRARESGIATRSYAEMLGLLMQGGHGLAVAGTHGKSTTTAMAAEILTAAGLDPTVVYGAAPVEGTGCRAGNGRMTLVEACEFRRNFLHLRPREAVILNVEADHFDCYPTRDALLAAFCDFAAALPHDGRLLIQARTQLAPREDARRAERDECLVRIAAAARCPVETFGDEVEADWQAADVDLGQVACPVDSAPAMKRQVGNLPHTSALGRYAFDLVHQGQRLGRVELAVPGRHNVGNAVAAAALAAGCGCPPAAVVAGLAGFRGLQRRLQRIGTAAGIDFWDDYAHHPTEIATTLQTIREVAPQSRVWCLFQPHQALRTARLLDELAWSLQNAERVLIAEIYRAREGPPRPGETTAADLAAKTREFGQEVYGSHAPAEIQQFLHTQLIPGDTLVVMGAGDIGRTAHGLLEWFRTHRAAG